MELYVVGALLFFLIGVVLSLLGSGGAILTIPVLVYVFDVNPYWATSYSMFIMGLSNWTATIDNIRKKYILYKIGLYFAIPGLLVTFLVRRFVLPDIPDTVFKNELMHVSKGSALMLVFSFLIFVTAIRTLKSKHVHENVPMAFTPVKSMFQGAAIGLITGFVGAGGGFLIVPILVLSSKIPIRQAIATSLFVISITTSLGFLGDLNPSVYMDWPFLIYCATFCVAGVLVANSIKDKFTSKTLKLIFGYFILSLSILIFIIEINKLGLKLVAFL